MMRTDTKNVYIFIYSVCIDLFFNALLCNEAVRVNANEVSGSTL